ncbi:PBECR2 nuclease fold domain-containing protein, partial [Campylobacter felis]|uniref:PBECR2 nuclease fold domain-containing protein n=1 Tax=Campylobacter felis TaxID=2974565 RepID=UPI00256AB6F9|nr:PBECR2 nuclease fold domain-containing protein [Campylobacter felis]
ILKGQDSNEKFKLYGNLEELKAWRKESKTKLDKARVNLSKIDEGGLSEEQKELLKLFKGEIKSVKIQVKDLKDIYTLKQGSAKVGAKKILIKHYGEEKTGGLEELLGIKEVIKKGEINLNSLEIKGDILRYGYDYEKDGVKLRVVVDEFKEGKKIFDYYSDRNFNHYEQGGYKPNLPTPNESIAENAEEKQKLLTFHTKKLLEYKGDLNTPLNAESELKTRDILDYIKKADLSPKEAVFLIYNAKDEAQILKRQILEAAQKWLETFKLKSLNDEVSVEIPQVVKEKLGKELILNQKDFKKIVEKGREKYIPQIKQTFNEPEAVFIDENGDLIFAKSIDDKLFFVNVNRDYGEAFKALSLAPKKNNNLLNKLDKAKEILKLDSKLRDSTAQQAFTEVLSAPNKSNAESIAQKEDQEQWLKTFGLKSMDETYTPNFSEEVKEALEPVLKGEEIKLTKGSFIKLLKENRFKYLDRIKETLENPQRVILQNDGALIFVRNFNEKKYFTSVAKNANNEWIIVSNAPKSENGLNNKIKNGGKELYNQADGQINASAPYDDIANSNIKLDEEIIAQQSENQALKTTTREIEKFMQLAQDLQNKSLSKNDKIQIIDNLVSALSSLEHKMPEFIEEIMEKANKATMPYASSVDRAKYKGFNASDKYAMLEAFRVIKLLDAYDDAEKLIKDIKNGKDIDFNNKIFRKMQNTEKALVLSQTQASLGVIKDFEKVLKNHEEDVNLLIDKALKLLGDKKTQNAGGAEGDLTKLKEAKGSEDIIFTDTKGKEHALTKETQKAWLEAFGLKSLDEEFIPNLPRELKEALGKELKLTKGSLYKIVEKGREKYIPQIKQTLQNPDFALRDRDNMLILAKQIGDKQYFTSINLETKDYFISVSNAPKKENILKNKVENGAKILYQSPNAKSIFYTDTLLQTDKSSANKIDEDIVAQKPQQIIKQAKEQGKSVAQTKEYETLKEHIWIPLQKEIQQAEQELIEYEKRKGIVLDDDYRQSYIETTIRNFYRDYEIPEEVKAIQKKYFNQAMPQEYEEFLNPIKKLPEQTIANDLRESGSEAKILQYFKDFVHNNYVGKSMAKGTQTAKEAEFLFLSLKYNKDFDIPNEAFDLNSAKGKVAFGKFKTSLKKGELTDKVAFYLYDENTYRCRKAIERLLNITPLKEFGTNYAEFYRDGKGAVKKLIKEAGAFKESGEKGEFKAQVSGAFYREELGDIDLVWGEITDLEKHKGYGLAHILDKHPEFDVFKIPQIIEQGEIQKTYNGYNVVTNDYIVGLNKGFKDKEGKVINDSNVWVVTSFEPQIKGKKEASSIASVTSNYNEPMPHKPLEDIIPQKNINLAMEKSSFDEKKALNSERAILKEKFERAKNYEEKIELITREFLKENERLKEQIAEIKNIIENKDYTENELLEAMDLINEAESSGEKLALKKNGWYIPIYQDDGESIESLAQKIIRIEKEKFEIKPLMDRVKRNQKRIQTMEWDYKQIKRYPQDHKYHKGHKQRLDKNIDSFIKKLLRDESDHLRSLSLNYNLNTESGLKKVRDLFYKSFKPNEEQIAIFEAILPVAKELNVWVRGALRDPYESFYSDNTIGVVGRYVYGDNSARVKHSLKKQDKGETLLHELIHSVTSRAIYVYEKGDFELLTKRQIEAIKNIKNIYEQIKEQRREFGFIGDYGLKNSHEMLAELSNPKFVEKLKKVNVFEKLINNILKLFISAKEFLGLKKTNAYDKLKENLIEIIQNYKTDFSEQFQRQKYRNMTDETKTNSYNLSALRNEVKEHLKPFTHKLIKNKNDNTKAIVTMSGIKEMLSVKAIKQSVKNGFKAKQHIKAVKALPALFEKAVFKDKQAQRHFKDYVKDYRIYSADFEGGKAIISVQERKVGDDVLYFLKLDELRLNNA